MPPTLKYLFKKANRMVGGRSMTTETAITGPQATYYCVRRKPR